MGNCQSGRENYLTRNGEGFQELNARKFTKINVEENQINFVCFSNQLCLL